MSILGSMHTGVSGMKAQGEALSVYGDNIANANTTGFKVSRPEFADVISKSIKGVSGGAQVGTGTRVQTVAPIMSQGSVVQTENASDLAITGDGFFTVDGREGRSYTRAGAFHFDKDGKLVNADNNRLQGFMADDNGKITSKMGDIQVSRSVIDAKATKEAGFQLNLDLRAEIAQKGFDPENPEKSSNFTTGVTVYDSAGVSHVLTAYFNKTSAGVWEYRVMAKGEEVVGGVPGKPVEQAKGTLVFDTDGRLNEHVVESNSFNFNKGALPNQEIKFDFGKPKKDGGDGLSVTQYGTASEAYKTVQDGYTAGHVAGLSFNSDGVLAATYTNGETINLAQVALTKFENPEGLFKAGNNLFKESRASGQPTTGSPESGGRGSIVAKALESSTTDIAHEFINMMTSQRNFQANSKVIGVADNMLEEVINLRRG